MLVLCLSMPFNDMGKKIQSTIQFPCHPFHSSLFLHFLFWDLLSFPKMILVEKTSFFQMYSLILVFKVLSIFWYLGKPCQFTYRLNDFVNLLPGSGIQWYYFHLSRANSRKGGVLMFAEPAALLGSSSGWWSLSCSADLWLCHSVLTHSARSQWWNMKTFWWYLRARQSNKICFPLWFTAVSWATYACALLVCFISACVVGQTGCCR